MNLSNLELAYVVGRVLVGINLLGHGLVRLPKVPAFRAWMVTFFEGTLLPGWLVAPFATAIPYVEFILGLLLISGLFTKFTLLAAAAVLGMLLLGSCLKEQWEAVGAQMVYVLAYTWLLSALSANRLALDGLLSR
jgi:thiosulfate dehydrogenase [quinone] large subunit